MSGARARAVTFQRSVWEVKEKGTRHDRKIPQDRRRGSILHPRDRTGIAAERAGSQRPPRSAPAEGDLRRRPRIRPAGISRRPARSGGSPPARHGRERCRHAAAAAHGSGCSALRRRHRDGVGRAGERPVGGTDRTPPHALRRPCELRAAIPQARGEGDGARHA